MFSRTALAMIAGLAICEPLAAACAGSSKADGVHEYLL